MLYLCSRGTHYLPFTKYQPLADVMKEILEEDECNDTYGRSRMYQALILKRPEHGRNPQWTYHLPCHGGNWDQPSSQAQTERDHEIRQGSQKVGDLLNVISTQRDH